MENVRGTQGMTKAKRWHLKKIGTCVGKVVVMQSKRPLKKIHPLLCSMATRVFFNCHCAAFGVTCVSEA
jgi:hypothetical protein